MEYSKEDLMEAKKQIWGVGENMGTEESKKIWEENAQFWDNAMGDESNEFHREVVRPKVRISFCGRYIGVVSVDGLVDEPSTNQRKKRQRLTVKTAFMRYWKGSCKRRISNTTDSSLSVG